MTPLLADDTYWQQSPIAPEGPVAQHISNVFWPIFWVSVVIFVGVGGAILYSSLRFRRKLDDEEPVQTHGNNRLEVAWTVAPFAILISLFILTATNMRFIQDPNPGPNALHVCVQGQRFNWSYFYERDCGSARSVANGGRDYTPAKNLAVPVSASALVVPTGRPIKLQLVSLDVNHSFYIPEISGQVNAIPGQKNEMWFQIDNPGTYHGACTELCGSNHAGMLVIIKAMSPNDYGSWCRQQAQKAQQRAGGNAAAGNGGCD